MQVKDVMTHHVITVPPRATVLQAAQLMLQNDISGLPVVDEKGELVGILSEGDFLHRGEADTERKRPRWLEFVLGPGRLAADYVHTHGHTVAEVMTRTVHTVKEDAPLDEAVKLMERHRIKRIPVLQDGKLVGVVSRANLLRALVSLSRTAPLATEDDRAIHKALLATLKKQNWTPPGVDVVVHDGVVGLWGIIADDRQRIAMKVAAENIPGVKAVEDHMTWVEPMSGAVIGPPMSDVA